MVSYWHDALANRQIDFDGSFRDLVFHPRMGLQFFMRFWSSWNDRAGIVIRYEDLREDPHKTFGEIANFIGLHVSDEEVAAAIEGSTLEKTGNAQQTNPGEFSKKFEEGFVFACKGTAGEGKAQFYHELNDYYQRLREQYQFDPYPF